MTPRIRRSGFQARGPRRTMDWGLGPAETQGVLTATSSVLWSLGTTPSQNLTLVRTRGLISYYQTSQAGLGDGFRGASGIYMMTEAAFTIGVTAALGPLTDANSDVWLWHSFFDLHAVTATEADGSNAVGVVLRQEIDSKAMRKDFDPTMVMVGVTEVVEHGVATAEFFADTRQLFKT